MLNLKIPPPIIGLCVAGAIFFLDRLLPSLRVEHGLPRSMAYPFVIVGLSIELFSLALFVRARTTINPLKPSNSKKLVTSGLYKVSRNPMYLGLLLLLTGWAFWQTNLIGFPLIILFVWYITEFQIKPEEQALAQLFGDEFTEYRRLVRRWL